MTSPTQSPRDTGRAEGLRDFEAKLDAFANAHARATHPNTYILTSEYKTKRADVIAAFVAIPSPPIDPEASDVEAVAIEINYARYFPTSSLMKRDAAQQWALEDESGKSYARKLAIAAINSLRAQRQRGDAAPVKTEDRDNG